MYTNKVNGRTAAIINLCQNYRKEKGLTYVQHEAKK